MRAHALGRERLSLGDAEAVERLFSGRRFEAVLHFAAHIIVPESVAEPLKYYRNNTCATRNLLQCAAEAGVKQIVFSSTAAVYGLPPGGVAREDSPNARINPYGTSKLMSEWMLRDLSAAKPLRHVALRYFNVAGSDPGGRIGQSTEKATLLVKVAAEAAVGRRDNGRLRRRVDQLVGDLGDRRPRRRRFGSHRASGRRRPSARFCGHCHCRSGFGRRHSGRRGGTAARLDG